MQPNFCERDILTEHKVDTCKNIDILCGIASQRFAQGWYRTGRTTRFDTEGSDGVYYI